MISGEHAIWNAHLDRVRRLCIRARLEAVTASLSRATQASIKVRLGVSAKQAIQAMLRFQEALDDLTRRVGAPR